MDGVLTANLSINTLIYEYNFHFYIRYFIDWPQIRGCPPETMRSAVPESARMRLSCPLPLIWNGPD